MFDIILSFKSVAKDDRDDESRLFKELFEKYAIRVKRLALDILENEHDADDAVGITFMKIMKYRDKFIGIDEKRVIGRISMITRCVCIDILKKRNRDYMNISYPTCVGADDDDKRDIGAEISDDTDVAHSVLDKEASDRLHRAINSLDSPAREIILFKFFDDMTNVEIAELLDMNASTVGTILQRSLKKLRKMLEGYYNDK